MRNSVQRLVCFDRMDAGDLLKGFPFDTWYKMLAFAGGVVLGASFFWEVKGLTNNQLQLLSGGAFLVGLGEWKNHKEVAMIKEANAYTGGPGLLTGTLRKPDFIGIVLDLAGVFLIARGVWKIVHG